MVKDAHLRGVIEVFKLLDY